MLNVLLCLVMACGGYYIATAAIPTVYPPARRALKLRIPKPLTSSQRMVNELARRIEGHITLDKIRCAQMHEMLKTLGWGQSPEEYTARAWAKAIILAAMSCVLVIFSLPLGLALAAAIGATAYKQEMKKLSDELEQHRLRIERELPQFAGTIQQTLSFTRDLVTIFGNYRKVCGETLAMEIDKTLNDIMTGNPQKALKSLEARVASAKLGQLTRGLQAVLRGDDQRVYFEMLAAEYRRAQDEEIEKMLLKRPAKLYPYMGLLFVCLALMICATLGADMVSQIRIMF